MRSREFILLAVAALCAGTVAAERPTPLTADDVLIVLLGEPNDPNLPAPAPLPDPNKVWDPAQHLTATWRSISLNMTSQLDNPAVSPDVKPQGPRWSLSLLSQVTVSDSNGLLGLAHMTGSAKAFDQDGREVSSSPTPSSSATRWYLRPHFIDWPTEPNGVRVPRMIPDLFSVSLPMDPEAKYPAVLSRVEWSMYALVANQFRTVDIPFKASDQWVELTPGMEILVEKASTEEGKYQFSIKARWTIGQADYTGGLSGPLRGEEKPPAVMVSSMTILDAAGQVIPDGANFGGSGGYVGINGQMSGTNDGTAMCKTCGNATTIRYTLALNPYEKEVRFVLENIPVPHF